MPGGLRLAIREKYKHQAVPWNTSQFPKPCLELDGYPLFLFGSLALLLLVTQLEMDLGAAQSGGRRNMSVQLSFSL